MQRQFGKLMNKSPGDNAKVAAILHDYEDADRLLAKVGTAHSPTSLALLALPHLVSYTPPLMHPPSSAHFPIPLSSLLPGLADCCMFDSAHVLDY